MWNFFQKEPLFICACEPSGDLYASLWIKNLKTQYSRKELEVFGIGGMYLKSAGVNLICDYRNLMSFGFSSGLSSLFSNYKMLKKIARVIYRIKPGTFVAVAYPGINLLLCRYAKKIGAKVIYLLPPQIWAWGKFRKYLIKKWVDLVISVFPFEYQFYNWEKIKVIYWQNPLFEELKRYQRNDYKKRIGFMPGSRLGEIKRNLPVIIEIIKNLKADRNIAYCLILHPDTFNHLNRMVQVPNLLTVTDNRYQVMKNCDLIITCSGTASLECAIMGIPQIFFNRPSFFDYHLFRHFLKIKELNLANLYYRKIITPSFVIRNKRILIQRIFDSIRVVDFS